MMIIIILIRSIIPHPCSFQLLLFSSLLREQGLELSPFLLLPPPSLLARAGHPVPDLLKQTQTLTCKISKLQPAKKLMAATWLPRCRRGDLRGDLEAVDLLQLGLPPHSLPSLALLCATSKVWELRIRALATILEHFVVLRQELLVWNAKLLIWVLGQL